MARTLERPLVVGAWPQTADAVVVPGAPLRDDGSLSEVLEERVGVAVELWKRGQARLLCVSGGRSAKARHSASEAEGMARRALELGLPPAALRVEGGARSTYENAARCAALLRPEGIRRVWIVTQPFHLRRAVYWFDRFGFDALGWVIEGSVEYEEPGRALRWVLAEYASWAKLCGIEVARKIRGDERDAT